MHGGEISHVTDQIDEGMACDGVAVGGEEVLGHLLVDGLDVGGPVARGEVIVDGLALGLCRRQCGGLRVSQAICVEGLTVFV